MQLRDEDDLQSSNTDRGRPMPLKICIAQNNDATFHENKYSHGILERMALVLHTISLVRHFDSLFPRYSKGCSNTGINSRALSLSLDSSTLVTILLTAAPDTHYTNWVSSFVRSAGWLMTCRGGMKVSSHV